MSSLGAAVCADVGVEDRFHAFASSPRTRPSAPARADPETTLEKAFESPSAGRRARHCRRRASAARAEQSVTTPAMSLQGGPGAADASIGLPVTSAAAVSQGAAAAAPASGVLGASSTSIAPTAAPVRCMPARSARALPAEGVIFGDEGSRGARFVPARLSRQAVGAGWWLLGPARKRPQAPSGLSPGRTRESCSFWGRRSGWNAPGVAVGAERSGNGVRLGVFQSADPGASRVRAIPRCFHVSNPSTWLAAGR